MKKILMAPLALGAALALSGPVQAQSMQGQNAQGQSMRGQSMRSQSMNSSQSDESRERSIALSKVPQPAKDAAKQALGADPTEAKIIRGTRPQQYELEAMNTSGGGEKAVHVTGDGKVLKQETENESHERGER